MRKITGFVELYARMKKAFKRFKKSKRLQEGYAMVERFHSWGVRRRAKQDSLRSILPSIQEARLTEEAYNRACTCLPEIEAAGRKVSR